MTNPQDALPAPGQLAVPQQRGPASPVVGVIRMGVGFVFLAAAILCQGFEQGLFGQEGFGAPVESVLNFGMSVDLGVAGIALLVVSVFAFFPARAAAVPSGVSAVAVTGAALTGIAFVAFLLCMPSWIEVLTGVRSRFDGLVGPLFFVGMPWVAGTVLSAVALRRPADKFRTIAMVALAVSLLLAVSAVTASALYGAAITD